MTRRPSGAPGRSALYAHLLARADELAAHPMATPGDREHLAALRAGRSVDVSVSALPEWARGGEPTHWWRRAIVTNAGGVECYDDDAQRWLADNGL
ncbi:hypothetical protein H7I41_24420 [Mycobacterium manitobense]|uniref:Uncharacterized protein n=1 Tax=[Mycobacterium] manitobense TaxID=190147 RepID=A0A9X2YRM7_9MYCO|nr:hypothetical protein [[Mycobacterium] manitobense]MCV7173075.1 hypothetical protein [[Mycobacterium] manitobense]